MFSFVTDKLQEKATNIPNSLKLLIFVSTNELTYWQTEQSLYSCCACAHVVNYHYSSPAWRQLISWQLIYYACPWGWPVCYVHIPIGIDILVICSKLYSEVTCNNAAANCTNNGKLVNLSTWYRFPMAIWLSTDRHNIDVVSLYIAQGVWKSHMHVHPNLSPQLDRLRCQSIRVMQHWCPANLDQPT